MATGQPLELGNLAAPLFAYLHPRARRRRAGRINQMSPMLRGLAYLFRQWEYSASSPKRLPLLSCVDVFVESLWAACGLRALQAASCTCAEIAEAVQLFMRARPALNRSQHGLANTLTRHRARTSLGTAAIVPPRSLWRRC